MTSLVLLTARGPDRESECSVRRWATTRGPTESIVSRERPVSFPMAKELAGGASPANCPVYRGLAFT